MGVWVDGGAEKLQTEWQKKLILPKMVPEAKPVLASATLAIDNSYHSLYNAHSLKMAARKASLTC